MVVSPSGLSYIDDYLSEVEAAELLSCIDAHPWMTDLRRRVQHYGYRYDYRARAVDRGMYLGPLPEWADALASRMHSEMVFDRAPDQLIVNEYEPGQGIASHVDCVPCFGPVVASLTLASGCQMDLSRGETTLSLMLRPRSLLILAGESRALWAHGIRARRSDVHDGARIPRRRRVSLTFRTVRLVDSVA
jgi:alkylated DNA repair dioxygenase AlkB